MTDPQAARTKQAVLAHVRQEVCLPVESVLSTAESLLTAARRHGADGPLPDLERIHTAAAQLLALVNNVMDPAALAARAGAAIEAFSAKLRHDLRTPINAIKGYGEMLLEDAETDGVGELVPELRLLLHAADDLLASINTLLPGGAHEGARPAEQPAVDISRLETASHLLADIERTIGPPQVREAAPLLTGRILVADDNERNRDLLTRRLERDGHQVTAVADGCAALDMARARPFDLILLDMMMPGKNGYEVLAAIKGTDATAATAVIMISALDEINSVVRCIEAGADDYMPKPFNPVLLRARISAALEKRRLRDLENAFRARIARELDLARDIQSSILPRAFPTRSTVSGYALMLPAREVGGDFFDFIAADEHHIGIAVADVSGKGVPAALFMAIAYTHLRTVAPLTTSPGVCLARLNALLAERNEQGMFVTVFFGILDTGTGELRYANGGHNYPALVKAGGAVTWLPGTGGMLLGMQAENEYSEGCIQLDPGDLLFIYTNGVVEAFDREGAEFSDGRLQAVLEEFGHLPVRGATEAVLAAVKTFESGAPQADDITCVAIRYMGT